MEISVRPNFICLCNFIRCLSWALINMFAINNNLVDHKSHGRIYVQNMVQVMDWGRLGTAFEFVSSVWGFLFTYSFIHFSLPSMANYKNQLLSFMCRGTHWSWPFVGCFPSCPSFWEFFFNGNAPNQGLLLTFFSSVSQFWFNTNSIGHKY